MPLPRVVASVAALAGSKVAKDVGVPIAKQVGKVVKRRLDDEGCKKSARAAADERGGRVGKVHFKDGKRRWVVADQAGTPLMSFPPYGDNDERVLATALRDVPLAECLELAPRLKKEADQRIKAEQEAARDAENRRKKQADEQRKREAAARKAREKAAERQRKAAKDGPPR